METMNNYTGNILIVDLESGDCETEELSPELVEKTLGGAALNLELYEKYKDREPLVLGTGFFTATFFPCSCLAVMTGKSPITGGIGHVPLTWQGGMELKLSGFDFVVILGKSEKPVRLWLHDGLSDLNDSADVWGKDVWESVDKIREVYGDDMIQTIIIGKAGENQVPIAQLSENYWGSKDSFGFGAVFGAKNFKAIAMRGLGALEVADGFFQKCIELKNVILNGAIKGKSGIKDFIAPLGIDAAIKAKIESTTHRLNACYNCPYPCYTFFKYREAPSAMAQTGVADPGCLTPGLAGLTRFYALGVDAPQAMEKCFKTGLQPAAAAQILEKKGIKDLAAAEAALDALAADGKDVKPEGLSPWPIAVNLPKEAGIFSSAVPPKPLFAEASAFGEGDAGKCWLKRQALAYTVGMCPIFSLLAPEVTTEKVVELVQMSAEWDDFTAEKLESILSDLIKKSSG
jgi:aldehyde:ferredoxin oxidoreductase